MSLRFSDSWLGAGRITPAVKWIVIVTSAMYVAQLLFHRSLAGAFLTGYLALTREGLLHGMIWQPVTYALLHDERSVMHLLMNMGGLWLLGPEVERRLGKAHFLTLYGVCTVLGGIGFVLIEPGHRCVGASAAVFGVMAAFAALFPHQLLSLFGLPFLTFDAWKMVLGIVLVEWVFLVTELMGGVAHSAHLAGALAGVIYARVVAYPGIVPEYAPGLRRWWRERRQADAPREATADPAEVDRILDKVASRGFGSLTAAERRTLEQASRERRAR